MSPSFCGTDPKYRIHKNNLKLFHRAWASYPLYSSELIDSCNLTSLWNFLQQRYYLHVLFGKLVIMCLKTFVQLYAWLQWGLDCQLHSYPCTNSKEGVIFHMPCKKDSIYIPHIFYGSTGCKWVPNSVFWVS